MSKKQTTSAASSSASRAELTIVIDQILYELLKAGKINQVLTWKANIPLPNYIAVVCAENADEPIVRKVKHMDIVGFGYVPLGYPEIFKADRKTTRFILEEQPVETGVSPEPVKEADTETEN